MRRGLFTHILSIVSIVIFWSIYLAAHLADLSVVFGYFIAFYEMTLEFSILLITYILGIIRASLSYIFIYLLMCLYNLQYAGYTNIKFFGIQLDTVANKIKINKLFLFITNNYYFFFYMFNFFFLSVIIYYSLFSNIMYMLFIIVFYFLIWANIKLKNYTKKNVNWKSKYFHLLLNLSLITICGAYINILCEIVAPLLIFKTNYFETIIKLLEDRQIIKLSQNNPTWSRLYLMNKEFLSKNALFILKNKIVDVTYFYTYKNMLTKSKNFNKEFNYHIINLLNSKNEFNSRNEIYEKLKINEFKAINNNIQLNNNNIKSSDILLNNIINKLNVTDNKIKHNLEAYLNWKLITLNNTGLNVNDFLPTQETPQNSIDLIKNEKLNYDLSPLLLSDEDLILSNNYIDLCRKINNNNNFNFDILLKKKINIYECLKFNYFNENFKHALQVNISYDELKIIKNKNNFYSIFNINNFNNRINIYSNIADVIEELSSIKAFFNELYNYNSKLNPSINFSLFKYNKFLLLWENSKFIKVNLDTNKLQKNFSFDEKKLINATENLLEKNNSNYINFEIKNSGITVSFDLSELLDYKELYLSWYLDKSVLFKQSMYMDDLPYFFSSDTKDALIDNIKIPVEILDPELDMEEGSVPSSEQKIESEPIPQYLNYQFFVYTNEENGYNNYYKLNSSNSELDEISASEYYKYLNLIKNYENSLNYNNYYNDLSYYYSTILKNWNLENFYSVYIKNKLWSDINPFILFMTQDKQNIIELYNSSRYQKFMHFHITNKDVLSFLKENSDIENLYILLFKYNVITFKEWILLINDFKKFSICGDGPASKHTFLNKAVYLSVFNKSIKSNIDEDINPISIHYQMELIKRRIKFFDMVYFTSKDMSSLDTDYVIQSMEVQLKNYKEATYDFELNKYSNNILEYLKGELALKLCDLDIEIEAAHNNHKAIYKNDYIACKKIQYWHIHIDQVDKKKNLNLYNIAVNFDFEESLNNLRYNHKMKVDTLYLYKAQREQMIKRFHHFDLRKFIHEIDEKRKVNNAQVDLEVQHDLKNFKDWVSNRRSLELLEQKKKKNALTNRFLNNNWDDYNKQRASEEFFKSNWLKKK